MTTTLLAVTEPLPPAAMTWVETVARLQRAVPGLVLHGRYTCGEIALVLDLPSAPVADLLRAGIGDLAPAAQHAALRPVGRGIGRTLQDFQHLSLYR